MKKILKGLIIASCALMLVGCGAEGKGASGDETFINEASKAVNKRWSSQNTAEKRGYTEGEMEKILNTEISSFEKAKEKIEEKELKNLADNYVEGVKKQIEAEKSNDYEVATKYLKESEELRKPALVSMVDNYGLVIDKENEQTYKDFKAQASVIAEESDAKKFAEELISKIEFKKSKEYSWTKYETILENTSDINFESISYNVQVKDKDGIVVDNSYLYLENFNKGNKQKVDFSTDKEDHEILVTLDYYNIKK
ncbi:hypothetical protein [uncultured Clostridium sp.]|uniref:LptM family lipoprotein n=1 Tax=uncultured Clostridium sp. TaxID=59620 RepID=UPI00263424C1|nr:hypothetical protein [uncultured Clostridium sp.]